MSETYVLDSFAVLALLGREVGSEDVAALLHKARAGEAELLMTWVNVGEVAYLVERRWGRERLVRVLALLEAAGIAMVEVGRELALRAAQIKAGHALAYADAFAAALAASRGGTLVTGDAELAAVEDSVRIRWLGRQ